MALKIGSQIQALLQTILGLEEGQIICLRTSSLQQARQLIRQIKSSYSRLEDEGIADCPIGISLSEQNSEFVVQIYKERPVVFELLELDNKGDLVIKERKLLSELAEEDKED